MENYELKQTWKFFESIYKNGKKFTKFGDIEIKKKKFHQHKSPLLANNIDINKIVASNKVFFGKNSFKYFTDYKDAK